LVVDQFVQQKMKLFQFILSLLVFGELANSQRTILDLKFSPFLKFGRRTFNSLIAPQNFAQGLEINRMNKKIQNQFPESSKFFCDTNGPGARSRIPPKSVHQLRPGDIDIIGAIGDSLTAGNGAFAVDVLQVLLEGRGVSWSIGGQMNWRSFLTLPNILKEFNPNLYGFSNVEQANADQKASRFNVASAGAMISDTVHQAKNLVKRMRSDAKVDMKNHWKLITYMIGGNDFCLDICYHQNQDEVIEKAGKNFLQALRILRENLPKTMVNVVLPPDVTILTRFTKRPAECQSLHYLECPCLFSLNHQKNRDRSAATIKKYSTQIQF
jgi:lysophospholipase L1-like esterase